MKKCSKRRKVQQVSFRQTTLDESAFLFHLDKQTDNDDNDNKYFKKMCKCVQYYLCKECLYMQSSLTCYVMHVVIDFHCISTVVILLQYCRNVAVFLESLHLLDGFMNI